MNKTIYVINEMTISQINGLMSISLLYIYLIRALSASNLMSDEAHGSSLGPLGWLLLFVLAAFGLGIFLIIGIITYSTYQGRLFRAVSRDDADEVRRILIESPEMMAVPGGLGTTALQEAAWRGKLKALQVLIDMGADLDETWDYPESNEGGWSALHITAINGQTEAADMLVKHGATINLKTWKGYTSLDVAIRNGHIRLQNLLKLHGGRKGRDLPVQK